MKIEFRESTETFCAASKPNRDEWIDTSFSQSPRAIGRLRYPGVSNGRYDSNHPILDEEGATIGLMKDGEGLIGYTFTCVYAGGYFWVAHQTFHSTLHSGGSTVSLVGPSGKFMFSKTPKFGVVESFSFGGDWVSSLQAYKLLDDGAYLFCLSKSGYCLFDTRSGEITSKVDFEGFAYGWTDFAISPKAKLLAVAFSARSDADPLDGEIRYKNFVRIYDMADGEVVGEQALPHDQNTSWTVDFSEDGRGMRVQSDLSTHLYELTAAQ